MSQFQKPERGVSYQEPLALEKKRVSKSLSIQHLDSPGLSLSVHVTWPNGRRAERDARRTGERMLSEEVGQNDASDRVGRSFARKMAILR